MNFSLSKVTFKGYVLGSLNPWFGPTEMFLGKGFLYFEGYSYKNYKLRAIFYHSVLFCICLSLLGDLANINMPMCNFMLKANTKERVCRMSVD